MAVNLIFRVFHRSQSSNYFRRNFMWWAVAKFVAVIVASYVIARATAKKPKSNRPTAATDDDWNMPVPDEGTPQCIFFGDCWTADWFVLGYGNYRYSPIRK